MTNIRPATAMDADAIAKVHVTAWRESYSGLVPDLVLDALSVSSRAERWRRILSETPRQPNFVAEQENTLVGDVMARECGPPR